MAESSARDGSWHVMPSSYRPYRRKSSLQTKHTINDANEAKFNENSASGTYKERANECMMQCLKPSIHFKHAHHRKHLPGPTWPHKVSEQASILSMVIQDFLVIAEEVHRSAHPVPP